jgi:hypothetical protein
MSGVIAVSTYRTLHAFIFVDFQMHRTLPLQPNMMLDSMSGKQSNIGTNVSTIVEKLLPWSSCMYVACRLFMVIDPNQPSEWTWQDCKSSKKMIVILLTHLVVFMSLTVSSYGYLTRKDCTY